LLRCYALVFEDVGQLLYLTVFGGLADSVDPCIFALYTSLLLSASIGGLKNVSKIAIAFISGVYLGYLLFGAMLKTIFNLASIPQWIFSIVLLGYGIAMLIHTHLESSEVFNPALCKEDRTVCKLAKKLRLGTIDPNKHGATGVALLGFIASFTLFPCSAQLYALFNFVTRSFGFTAWLPLACLYTAFFVLPLILISLAVIGLTRVSRIYGYVLSRQKIIKISASFIMIAIALHLLLTTKSLTP